MSNNNNLMYTSTPIRNQQRSNDDEDEIEYDSTFYSLPKFNTNNSNTNEFQNLPVNTMPELLNENELQLVIETDTDDTKYKTPDTSFYKMNKYRSYVNGASTSSNTTEYKEIPFHCKPSTSANNTNSSSINSKNKLFLLENADDLCFKDLQCLRGRFPFQPDYEETIEETDEETDDYQPSPKLINENKPKPHNIPMETYPSSTPLKKLHKTPANIPLIKEDDYQEIPSLLHIFDTMDSSTEKTLNPIYVKYSSKDDLSAKSDSINMLSVVISTVMLLASKSQVPQNYVTWTLKYLKCIKNKQGQHPPNIKKIQKMLTSPSTAGTGQWQCMDFLTGKNPGKRVDLTKKRKK